MSNPLSAFRCPSPILHEQAGDLQGGDGEIHREREPTLERTRSAGESYVLIKFIFCCIFTLLHFYMLSFFIFCPQRPNGTSPPPRSWTLWSREKAAKTLPTSFPGYRSDLHWHLMEVFGNVLSTCCERAHHLKAFKAASTVPVLQ